MCPIIASMFKGRIQYCELLCQCYNYTTMQNKAEQGIHDVQHYMICGKKE